MSVLVLEHVPDDVYDQICSLAMERQRTPAAAALEILNDAIRKRASAGPLPDEPFLTEDMSAPYLEIPWTGGTPVTAVEVPPPPPEPHDFPDEA